MEKIFWAFVFLISIQNVARAGWSKDISCVDKTGLKISYWQAWSYLNQRFETENVRVDFDEETVKNFSRPRYIFMPDSTSNSENLGVFKNNQLGDASELSLIIFGSDFGGNRTERIGVLMLKTHRNQGGSTAPLIREPGTHVRCEIFSQGGG